jgi:hypothetical protein
VQNEPLYETSGYPTMFMTPLDEGRFTVPETESWQTWQTLDVPGVSLPGGIHTLQMVMDTGGYYNTVSNFNWFSLD